MTYHYTLWKDHDQTPVEGQRGWHRGAETTLPVGTPVEVWGYVDAGGHQVTQFDIGDGSPIQWRDYLIPTLIRPALPPQTPEWSDPLTTEQVDALPVGTLVRAVWNGVAVEGPLYKRGGGLLEIGYVDGATVIGRDEVRVRPEDVPVVDPDAKVVDEWSEQFGRAPALLRDVLGGLRELGFDVVRGEDQ